MIEVENAHPRTRLPKEPFRRLLRCLLRREGVTAARLSVVFVGHEETRRLNAQFLNHRRSTDVIAFPLGEEASVEGEIYVNIDQAREQCALYGAPFAEETARLVLHGTLHLLGYDDRTPRKRRTMRGREDAMLRLCWHGLRSDLRRERG